MLLAKCHFSPATVLLTTLFCTTSLVLSAHTAGSSTNTIFDEIRRSLTSGEAALQQHSWQVASDAYERALDLLTHNSLWLNVAAESQLYNNVGWAAYKLGHMNRSVERLVLGALSCDRAMNDGFFDCVDKVYENLHEVLHKVMGRRREALKWMRQGVKATASAAKSLGIATLDALSLGASVRVRLGYLLVLENELSEAEYVLAPLLSSDSLQLIHERRALLQEAATYSGWSSTLRRDWASASDAFGRAASLALPRQDAACVWRIQEGWLPNETVWPLPIEAPSKFFKPQRGLMAPPWCRARALAGTLLNSTLCTDDTDALNDWQRPKYSQHEVVRVKLVELHNVFVSGEDGSAIWKPAPACVFYVGEHTVAASLPSDWGLEAVLGGAARRNSAGDETVVTQPVADSSYSVSVVLLDATQGHKMFWHHQTETVTRLCIVISRLFERDAEPAADLPEAIRAKLKAAVLLIPKTLVPTATALLKRGGHSALKALNQSNRIEHYDWRDGAIFHFKTAFFIDWPPASPRPAWSLTPYGTRRYSEPVFRLHYVPAPLLQLQAVMLKRAFPQAERAPYVLFYSRGDTAKRHIQSETMLLEKLHSRLEKRGVGLVAWRGGVTPDIERAANDWSRAALIIGPHGAGLANLIHCSPGTNVIVLPAADAHGAPSASDEYVLHLARALDLRLSFLVMDTNPTMFFNYSEFSESQLSIIVNAVETTLFSQHQYAPVIPAANFTLSTSTTCFPTPLTRHERIENTDDSGITDY